MESDLAQNTNSWVALLGTKGGPAIRPGSSMPTSNLLCLDNRKIVIDCGLGVSRALTEQNMHLKELSLIFITHLHSDHYLELGPLLHTAWCSGLSTPVSVYGPQGLDLYWEGFLASMQADIDLRIEDEGRPDLRALVSFNVVDAGKCFSDEGISVDAIRTIHPPLTDSFAFRFSDHTHSVVFSGDSAPSPLMAEFAAGADLLIHEAMLEEALVPLMARIGNADDRLMRHWLRSHTLASEAAKIAQKAGVKTLAVSHRIPADDPSFTDEHWRAAVEPHWSGHFLVGNDGQRIALNR